jgi:hypothetical protein
MADERRMDGMEMRGAVGMDRDCFSGEMWVPGLDG